MSNTNQKRLIIPARVSQILPEYQRKVMSSWELQKPLDQLEIIANQVPPLYSTDKLLYKAKETNHEIKTGDVATAYLHYFIGGTDIWVTEADYDEDLFYTYTILNGDLVMSEYGYQCISEMVKCKIELDFYFKPCILQDALYKKDSKYFRKPLVNTLKS